MPDRFPAVTRFAITAAVLIGGIVALQATGGPGNPPPHRPLRALPLSVAEWHGSDLPLMQHIIDAAGVDDYANREYSDGTGNYAQLYIGYYNSQRSGDLIHSPRNCLPAAGWESLRAGRLQVRVASGPPIEVNDFLIAKGLQRQVVLYWYQGRGRTVASEYVSKLWMMADAVTRRRTDGALVRIVVPVRDSQANAHTRAVAFVQALYPQIREVVPD